MLLPGLRLKGQMAWLGMNWTGEQFVHHSLLQSSHLHTYSCGYSSGSQLVPVVRLGRRKGSSRNKTSMTSRWHRIQKKSISKIHSIWSTFSSAGPAAIFPAWHVETSGGTIPSPSHRRPWRATKPRPVSSNIAPLKIPQNGGFNGKIIHERGIVHCHVWLRTM